MMIEQYREDVRRFYMEQRELGNLSLNLTYPTCANLRNECLVLFQAGCTELDLRVLKSFMGRAQKEMITEAAIRRADPDKFKAVSKFLGKNTKTSERNFELLAWLIGFENRPYSKYHLEKKKRNIKTESEIMEAIETPLRSRQIVNESGSLQTIFDPQICPIQKAETHKIPYSFTTQKTMSERQRNLVETYTTQQNGVDKINNLEDKDGCEKPKITLEYPSGVKLSVATADLDLISKLIRL